MSAAITPESVADMLTSGDNDFHDGNDWYQSISATGNVVSIGVTPHDEEGEKLPEVHFRAVVVEGDRAPIVAARPDVDDHTAVQGPRFGEDAGESIQNGWSVGATNHVIFGGSGHISFAEARRMGAALIALADQAEAQAGGESRG